MKFAFRADASIDIGSGHVMRCLALADKLRAQGAQTLFLCRNFPGHLYDIIEARGHALHRLPPPDTPCTPDAQKAPAHAAWLGVAWQQDSEECAAALAAWGRPDWLVVDHYAIDRRWEQRLRKHGEKIMVIDDLADRAHDCDLLLNQNLQSGAARYDGRLPKKCRRLLGPRFALLHPEFNAWRTKRSTPDGHLHRLLVFFGGSDPHNFSATAVQAIRASSLGEQCHVDLVLGAANPHRAAIAAICRSLPKISVHTQTPNMAALMAEADLMIGAAGTTSWERCCLGLPAIVVSVADNQRENGRQLARHRAAIYIGDAVDTSAEHLSKLLDKLAARPSFVRRLAQRALQITEGKGVDLLALALHAEQLQLRPARIEDCERLWRWRNDPKTRQASFDSRSIDLAEHRNWYRRVLDNPEQTLLLGSIASQNIGVLRYDIGAENQAEVSVYLDPDLHGIGLGSPLIAAGCRWLSDAQPLIKNIVARIRPNNSASRHAFTRAGFSQQDVDPLALHWHTE